MTTHSRIAFAAALVAISAAPSPARADETLHEGARVRAGAQITPAETRLQVGAKADLAVIPVPGAKLLSGTQISAVAGTDTKGGKVDLDKGQVLLLRWPHLDGPGLSRDRTQGSPWSVELGAVRLPFLLGGDTGSPNYAFVEVGASGAVRRRTEAFGARTDMTAMAVAATCQIEAQAEIVPRLKLQGFAQASAAIESTFSEHEGKYGRTQLELRGGARINVDLGSTAPYRTVIRTHPTTGEKTQRRIMDEGKRFHLTVLDIEGLARPLDQLSRTPAGLRLTVGLGSEF